MAVPVSVSVSGCVPLPLSAPVSVNARRKSKEAFCDKGSFLILSSLHASAINKEEAKTPHVHMYAHPHPQVRTHTHSHTHTKT